MIRKIFQPSSGLIFKLVLWHREIFFQHVPNHNNGETIDQYSISTRSVPRHALQEDIYISPCRSSFFLSKKTRDAIPLGSAARALLNFRSWRGLRRLKRLFTTVTWQNHYQSSFPELCQGIKKRILKGSSTKWNWKRLQLYEACQWVNSWSNIQSIRCHRWVGAWGLFLSSRILKKKLYSQCDLLICAWPHDIILLPL